MSQQTSKNADNGKVEKEVLDELAKPKESQIEEGTLLLMEDMLEERNSKTRRVTDKAVPASEDRRKSNRRKADSDERA